jgi:hypothetical protein
MFKICDKCNNYEISMDNMSEFCHAKIEGSLVIPRMTDDYIKERFEGEKKHCKSFNKIQNTCTVCGDDFVQEYITLQCPKCVNKIKQYLK